MENTLNKTHGMSVRSRRILAYVVLIFFTLVCLIWFYILLINSTRSHAEMTKGFTVLPSTHFGDNWQNLLNGTLPIGKGFINSLIVSIGNSILCVYFSAMTAYAIHTYHFKGRDAIAAFILAVMMIPGQVTALGFIQLIGKMGLDDTLIPLIIPAIASPVTYFYMKQYMESNMPMSLVEAARIDGSGEFRTFNSIALPIMKPAMATQAIFTFVYSWNQLFMPSILLTDNQLYTMPLMVSQLRGDIYKVEYGAVYLGLTLSVLPLFVIYFALSKYIIAGVALGSVKG